MFSNIANESYDVDFNEFLKIKDTGRKTTVELPIIKYETQRLNFWYRTGFRINELKKTIDFFEVANLKKTLLRIMWKYFDTNWRINNPCTWTFICICDTCRANLMTILN